MDLHKIFPELEEIDYIKYKIYGKDLLIAGKLIEKCFDYIVVECIDTNLRETIYIDCNVKEHINYPNIEYVIVRGFKRNKKVVHIFPFSFPQEDAVVKSEFVEYKIFLDEIFNKYYIFGRCFSYYVEEVIKKTIFDELENRNKNRVEFNKKIEQENRKKVNINYIYFIQEKGTNMIKIGKTKNVQNRLSALQTANPNKLELLVYFEEIEKTKYNEKKLHEKFKDFRKHGEWFYPAKPIMDYIKTCI